MKFDKVKFTELKDQIVETGKAAGEAVSTKIKEAKIDEKLADAGAGITHFAEQTGKATVDVVAKAGEKVNETVDQIKEYSALDDKLNEALENYNVAYTNMDDNGTSLHFLRERCTDSIDLIETLINSIANHPKEFSKYISDACLIRENFKSAQEYAQKELELAKKSATGAAAGVATGAAVASMAPTAAMWVATTFGTASTGTAISTLTGAAASKAALAWLGGGALAAGGGGTAAGSALLALAGPIGWGLAGASILTSIALFTSNKLKNDTSKKENIKLIIDNTAVVNKANESILALLKETAILRDNLMKEYTKCLSAFGKDFTSLSEEMQLSLGSLVNNTLAIACLIEKGIE